MPDMAHSVAYEANYTTYYYNNTWGSEEEYRQMAGPRTNVKGTVARGYLPSQYSSLESFRESADETHAALQDKVHKLMSEDASLTNPIKFASEQELEKTLAHGKQLYTTFCAVCHGEKGNGNGILYNDGNGKYSAKPANLISDDFIASKDGRFLNAILHGKGQMQPHADKLSAYERWEVIHYVRSLQATEKKQEYKPIEGGATAPAQEVSLEESFSQLLEKAAEEGADASELKIELDNVLYSVGKAALKSESFATLDVLVALLTSNADVKIEIDGHTDNTGDAAKNLKLSEDRAHAVYDYLVGHGIAAERLAYKGYGDTQPVASNDTEEGKAMNRRTEVKIIN